jgi:hypothetical protein
MKAGIYKMKIKILSRKTLNELEQAANELIEELEESGFIFLGWQYELEINQFKSERNYILIMNFSKLSEGVKL